ncbi:MAG: Glutamine synthetase [Candidatus Magnetoglobus multicellularis str. Araruama]|uniref:Glutamine synthetase n=1 Tax=Candidatus Magnetoglobus multicellularis str. Araruama TaxID=890399 RepID=A0A1V1P2I9_9BACT|nr:MAG: Glutamine synthetase [Candidatus Magnetoglobus multicellularis str. Araruama]
MSILCNNKEDVLKLVHDKNVSFIQFWFTDVLGLLKSFAITPSELESGISEGMGFDGSSIEGFARIHESDMVAMPDPKTFQFLPWRPDERPVARMFCDILNPDGSPYVGDPRFAFKNLLGSIAKKGYTYYLGPELEYFYFKDSKKPEGIDDGGYFDSRPLDMGADLRRETIFALQDCGIQVEYSHHEVAPSQHEIDLRYDEGLQMADKTMTYRLVAKEIARKYGYYATFMPKPLFGENGSGMHVHQSLFEGKKNLFFDGSDQYHLSKVGKNYIAGLMKHAREIIAVTNQWVNSYKRLVPGYEAPVYISWARRNRSAMIRVPMYKPGKEMATRMEFRAPDPSCNPYLAFSVMLAAGLKGIEEGYELPEPIEDDIFEMSEAEKKERGITTLPGNLYEAILEVEKSELVKNALGDHIFNKFVDNKKIEWDKYRTHVSKYEIEKYLPFM